MPDKAVDLPEWVPLFPLPNVVLLPGAVLPLHIFEQRYRVMTADALRGDRLVAMALLADGWQRHYHNRPAIEPVVCVGEIVSHEQLPDGRYNFLLLGRRRARVVKELGGKPYRLARLAPIEEKPAMEIDLEHDRARLREWFDGGALAGAPAAAHFAQLLAGPLPTPVIADVLAFNLIDDVRIRQELLAEPCVVRRVRRVVECLGQMAALARAAARAYPGDPALN